MSVLPPTLCLACLHSVQAISDTLPAFRRLRCPSAPPPLPPPAPPLAPPLVLLLATLLPALDGDEPDDWSCWFEGARERKADMAVDGSGLVSILVTHRICNFDGGRRCVHATNVGGSGSTPSRFSRVWCVHVGSCSSQRSSTLPGRRREELRMEN